MSKSEKSAYFGHVFAKNFFGAFFQTFFNGFENQREILRFLIPILNFWEKKFFFALSSTFFKTLIANAQETAQKNGKSFFMNVS